MDRWKCRGWLQSETIRHGSQPRGYSTWKGGTQWSEPGDGGWRTQSWLRNQWVSQINWMEAVLYREAADDWLKRWIKHKECQKTDYSSILQKFRIAFFFYIKCRNSVWPYFTLSASQNAEGNKNKNNLDSCHTSIPHPSKAPRQAYTVVTSLSVLSVCAEEKWARVTSLESRRLWSEGAGNLPEVPRPGRDNEELALENNPVSPLTLGILWNHEMGSPLTLGILWIECEKN